MLKNEMMKAFLLILGMGCFVSAPLKAALYLVTYTIEIIDYQRIETPFDPFGALIEPLQVTETQFTVAEFEIHTTFEQNEKQSKCLNSFGSLQTNCIRVDDRSYLPTGTLEAMHIPNAENKQNNFFQFDFKAMLPNSGFSLKLAGGKEPILKLTSYKTLQQQAGFIQLIWQESSQSIVQQVPSTTQIYNLPTNNNILNYSLRVKRNKKLMIL
jgi:hypothetical protein